VNTDVIIVGGGIVGLATAFQLQQLKPTLRIALIEKETSLAKHQTGNNSGVIHSGIYYKPGSLKATNCVRGYNLLLDFCRKYEVPFDLCGKIIVATEADEIPLLHSLYGRGQQNGLQNLKMLNAGELKEYEPHVNGIAGVAVPQTGIIDYTAVAKKYAEQIRKAEGEIILGEQVIDIQAKADHIVVASQKQSYTAKLVINCAGLYSDKIARLTLKNVNVKIIPFRGEYYKLKKEKEHLVKNLI
jgi:L-2-hydroxyglutarate oxidase